MNIQSFVDSSNGIMRGRSFEAVYSPVVFLDAAIHECVVHGVQGGMQSLFHLFALVDHSRCGSRRRSGFVERCGIRFRSLWIQEHFEGKRNDAHDIKFVEQMRITDVSLIDERAIAAAQVANRVAAVSSRDAGMRARHTVMNQPQTTVQSSSDDDLGCLNRDDSIKQPLVTDDEEKPVEHDGFSTEVKSRERAYLGARNVLAILVVDCKMILLNQFTG